MVEHIAHKLANEIFKMYFIYFYTDCRNINFGSIAQTTLWILPPPIYIVSGCCHEWYCFNAAKAS